MELEFESERLRFRPLAAEDVDLSIAIWTDPEVVKYVAEGVYTEAEIIEEMPYVVNRAGGGCIGVWVIEEKASGEKLGSVFLLPMPIDLDDTDWDLVQGEAIPDGPIEVGYVLIQSAWGKGYATEACRRITRFAFEETPLQEIWGVTDPENEASKNVLRKCGYGHEPAVHAYQHVNPGFRAFRDTWLAAQDG